MKLDNLNKVLVSMSKDIAEDIKNDIDKKKAVRTGKMKASIDYKVIKSNKSISIDFYAIDYYKYVDEGTKYIKARNFTKDVIDAIKDKYEDKIREAMIDDINDELNKKIYKK